MAKKAQPIVILLSLLSILTFLIGFKYGKIVERADKSYALLPTITPVEKKPTPPPIQKNAEFNTYLNPYCGITFLYPEDLKETETSSKEAELAYKTQKIFVSCEKKTVSEAQASLEDIEEVNTKKANGQNIKFYEGGDLSKKWIIKNSALGISIFFETSDNLTNLVFKTLEFVK